MATSTNLSLEAMLPDLLKLIQGQQYDYLLKNPGAASLFGMQAPANAVPLNDAIVKMAYGLLPNWATQGLTPTAASGASAGGQAPQSGGQRAMVGDIGESFASGGWRAEGGRAGPDPDYSSRFPTFASRSESGGAGGGLQAGMKPTARTDVADMGHGLGPPRDPSFMDYLIRYGLPVAGGLVGGPVGAAVGALGAREYRRRGGG